MLNTKNDKTFAFTIHDYKMHTNARIMCNSIPWPTFNFVHTFNFPWRKRENFLCAEKACSTFSFNPFHLNFGSSFFIVSFHCSITITLNKSLIHYIIKLAEYIETFLIFSRNATWNDGFVHSLAEVKSNCCMNIFYPLSSLLKQKRLGRSKRNRDLKLIDLLGCVNNYLISLMTL